MQYQHHPLLLSLLWLLAIAPLHAQVVTQPLSVNTAQNEHYWKTARDKAALRFLQKSTQAHTVPLPFFDDFSGSDPTWALSRFYFALPIHSIWFWNNGTGRAFGNRHLSLKTPNRGREWLLQANAGIQNILSVQFPENSATGFACGSAGWFATTADSGLTWTNAVSPSTATLTDLYFANGQQGILLDTTGNVFFTGNGGQSWGNTLLPFSARSVYMANGQTAFAAGDSARIAKTADGGQTWTLAPTFAKSGLRLNKISFVSPAIGLAMGDSGLIFRTQDGGNSWSRVYAKTTGDVLDIGFAQNLNQNIGWATGRGGLLLSTTDGGKTWAPLRTGTNDDLLTIRMITEYQGWVGTSNGRLLHMLLDPMRADSKWWERNSGTYINNTYCVNPISYGVATFDGLNDKGLPYSLVNGAVGACDTLTSVQIDVAGVANPVYVSFYYQPGGKVKEVMPNDNDSLVLQFKGADSTWVTAWRVFGNQNQINTPFRYTSVAIPDAQKHGAFQFRFINFGNQNMAFDIWNLDYVRVNEQNSPTDSSALDVAVMEAPGRLLKNFYAYPVDQFNEVVNRPDFFTDAVSGKVRNLNPEASGNTNQSGTFTIKDLRREQTLVSTPDNIVGLGNPIPNKNVVTDVSIQHPFYQPQIGIIPQATTLQYGVVLDGGQYNTLPNNDTVYSELNLSTYMAYDDGSAELSRYVDGAESRGAVRFDLERTDTLTDIHLFFPRLPSSQTQTISFLLMAYSEIDTITNTDKELFRASFVLPPLDSINRFDRFSLRSIPIEKRIIQGGKPFYVGWQQRLVDNGNEFRIGVDVNSENPRTFYYNSEAKWMLWQFDGYPPMIRPVFGIETPTSVKPGISAARSPFFPNPARQFLYNRETFSHLQILNAVGQLVDVVGEGIPGKPIAINLQTGLYFLKWQQANGQWVSQRLVVE